MESPPRKNWALVILVIAHSQKTMFLDLWLLGDPSIMLASIDPGTVMKDCWVAPSASSLLGICRSNAKSHGMSREIVTLEMSW